MRQSRQAGQQQQQQQQQRFGFDERTIDLI
jgi:hypothetical protein